MPELATPAPPPATAHRLLQELAALPVSIDAMHVEWGDVPLCDYPGGCRPSATVFLTGRGSSVSQSGRGEHVAWTREAHQALVARLPSWIAAGRSTVGALSAHLTEVVPDRLARAAVESAVADLALLQAGHSLASLAGSPASAMRWVVSFEAVADPVAMAARKRSAAGRDVELKVDVDPNWPEPTWRSLARLPEIAVLDWKGRGTPAQHRAAARWLPGAWLEDPGDGIADSLGSASGLRVSRDATIQSANDIVALVDAGSPVGAINIKISRVGGLLEAVRCFAVCQRLGLEAYVGGMFEVGVGRGQARALAALLSPDGPNDLAPHADAELARAAPRWRFDARLPGLGAAPQAEVERR